MQINSESLHIEKMEEHNQNLEEQIKEMIEKLERKRKLFEEEILGL